jgi:hypothetical protein
MTDPVAFFDPQGKGFYWAQPTKITAPTIVDVEPLPLYTQRTWVGLTDEEMDNFVKAVWGRGVTAADFIRAIEAKLKDKNF